MRGKGRPVEVKVGPWLSLLSLAIFLLSFPLADSSCDFSYALQDEFGQETTVARMGGTLVIACKTTGSWLCPKSIPNTQKNGKFEIEIKPDIRILQKEIKCCCDQAFSVNDVMIKDFLCSPSQDSACSNTELCHRKPDGTVDCKQGADVCVVAGTRNPAYQIGGSTPGSIKSMEYCEALKTPEKNEVLGQVEVRGDLELTYSKYSLTFFSSEEMIHRGTAHPKCRVLSHF